MRWRRIMSGVLLFLIEGPRSPWWLAPLVMVPGLAALLTTLTEGRWLQGWAVTPWVVLAVLGLWWSFSRRVQFEYYKSVAKQARHDRCPVCEYDLRRIATRRCPECGTEVDEFLRRIRAATRTRPPDGEQ